MATVKRFEDLRCWQVARTLAVDIYARTKVGAFAKDYGLKEQIQRAVVSIGSNIAEGNVQLSLAFDPRTQPSNPH